MSYSLPSRDIIADSVELIVTAQSYDGNISIPGELQAVWLQAKN